MTSATPKCCGPDSRPPWPICRQTSSVGDVGQRIDEHLAAEHAERMNQLSVAMRSERYAALLAEIGRWRADPPFTAAAGRPAEALQNVVVQMAKRLRKRLTRATKAGGAPEDMHRARKTGKRTRYAAEVAPAGDIPDLVHARHRSCRTFSASTRTAWSPPRCCSDSRRTPAAEDAFGYGVLIARERRLAEEARQQARAKN